MCVLMWAMFDKANVNVFKYIYHFIWYIHEDIGLSWRCFWKWQSSFNNTVQNSGVYSIVTHFNILHFKTNNLSISLNMLINMIQNAKKLINIFKKIFLFHRQTHKRIHSKSNVWILVLFNALVGHKYALPMF